MANLRTTNFQGFNFASGSDNGNGSGIFLYSGSMVLNPTNGAFTSYSGVGMELIGHSESYLKFHSSTSLAPGELDIRAQNFFIGDPATQFISGSGNQIEISSSNFHLTNQGHITMSGDITANAGYIGNWAIVDGKLSGSNATLDAVGAALYHTQKGPGSDTPAGGFHQLRDEYYIDFTPSEGDTSTAGKYFVKFGPNFSVSESGILFASGAVFEGTITASAGLIGGYTIGANKLTTTGFEIGDSTQTYAISSSKFNVDHTGILTASAGQIGGWVINSNNLVDDGNILKLAPDSEYPISASKFQVSNTGEVTASAGQIGGWTIDSTKLHTTNLSMLSSGIIQTKDFASGVSGWKIDQSGEAEFENATIRGTLSTAVFEKESVNAVGGQLYVANSTVLTGSGQLGGSTATLGVHRNTDTTMSVVNVTGFTGSEIITAKKFSPTGFSTEYMLVESTSRAAPDSETDFSGFLFVERGYGGGSSGDSGSLGEAPKNATDYSGSQVIVSTGRSGSGYIRLNANPNDDRTPYIDIVERTGSGLYDIQLKARLGDLSGVANTGPVPANPGFGLYSENVYLSGTITASAGRIGGWTIGPDKAYVGVGTLNNSNTAFYADNSGNFSLKDKLHWNGTTLAIAGNITIEAGSTSAVDFGAGAAASASAAQSTADTAETNAQTGISNAAAASSSAGAASSSAGTALTNAATATTNAGTAQTAIDAMESQLVLTPTGMDISSSGQSPDFGLAHFGTTTQFYDGVEAQNVKLQLNASGVKAYGDDANTYANVSLTGLDIVEDSVNVANFGSTMRVGVDAADKSAMRVDASGNITLGTSNKDTVKINADGTAEFSGSISASAGQIAGFSIDGTKLKQGTTFHLDGASDTDYFISSSKFQVTPAGDITASNADFDGYAIARSLRQKTVTITQANMYLYVARLVVVDPSDAVLTNGTQISEVDTYSSELVLNGDLGGEVVSHVIINIDMTMGDIPSYANSSGDVIVSGNGTEYLHSSNGGVHNFYYQKNIDINGTQTNTDNLNGYQLRPIVSQQFAKAGAIRSIKAPKASGASKAPVTVEVAPNREVDFLIPTGLAASETGLGGMQVAMTSVLATTGQALKNTGD